MRIFTVLALVAAPTMAAAQIVPLNGTWNVTPRTSEVADTCPEEMTPALDQMADQMSQESSFEVDWKGSFDPNEATISGGDDGVEWTRIDAETWEGDLQISADGPQVGTMRMQITEPGKIDSTTVMMVDALMSAQGQQVPGLDGCELNIEMEMTHAG